MAVDDEPLATPDFSTPRDILSTMEVRLPGRRRPDGAVAQDLLVPVRLFLYGPFLRLPAGRYCLSFDGDFPRPLQGGHPMLGVEVIAQNRMLRAWRDFTHEELRAGDRTLVFEVPPALSIESGADAPFEFRFTGFGTARFTLTGLTLRAAAEGEAASPMRWRMLGRLRLLPVSGAARLSPLSVSGLKFWRSWSPLFLPAGLHRLEIGCTAGAVARPADPALEITVRTRDGHVLGTETFSGADLSGGRGGFLFEVPPDASLDSGLPQKIDIGVRHFRNARLTLSALDIVHLPAGTGPAQGVVLAPSPRGASTRKKILIFGNCQGSLVARAFRENPGFSKRFSVKHHFMELPANLHEQGRRDIEECDLLLIQDIKEWEQYPLRAHVPDDLPTLRYPCVRFASLWPFDAFNGPDDKVARNKDFPNFEFTYFDGLLARLRKEIPDPEARFAAYRGLDVKGVIDPKRLHAFEEKRLIAMDEKFPAGMGAYILENFRRKQVFYTTAHPNGAILAMLMKSIARELGVRQMFWFPGPLDSLRSLQIPVHPKVADALGVTWAGTGTGYLVRGEKVTWEDYFRKYIAYYG
ncbi:WcbI family polysaccharide biosynthesis putative acetyltransferase [Azorhizobium doebereinerae]|uniref:WcbI family polysaccharide biosynthesis putative acetyltransferase n=1 Tax=Azorhizobium doebereinerae TaxID=281091 RepID=UPI00041C762E|nr:WcbI family polysaccharide biosynthesis putative acetyltransferase [Azorhizobium doebereinerae]